MRRALTSAVCVCAAAVAYAQAPAFEVASIRPNSSGTVRLPDGRIASGTNIATHKGRFTAQNIGFRTLVYMAYGVQEFQVEGGPRWMLTERFDVDAKAEEAVDDATVMRMLQPLLVERFGLALRREIRQLPAHVLVSAATGHRLRPAAPGATKKAFRFTLLGINDDKSQRMRLTGTGTLGDLTSTLSRPMRMPVVDATGISGIFDLTADWNSESFGNSMKVTERDAAAGAPLNFPAMDPELNAVFQRELGLKFETRRAPVEMLTIDAAERPTQN